MPFQIFGGSQESSAAISASFPNEFLALADGDRSLTNQLLIGLDGTDVSRRASARAYLDFIDRASWATLTTNYTAQPGDKLIFNLATSSLSLTLPASPLVGSMVQLVTVAPQNSSNTLQVLWNGQNFQGRAIGSVFLTAWRVLHFLYVSSTYGWTLLGGQLLESAPSGFIDVNLYQGTANTLKITPSGGAADLVILKNHQSTTYPYGVFARSFGDHKYLNMGTNAVLTTLPNTLSFEDDGFIVGGNANFNTLNNWHTAISLRAGLQYGFDIVTTTNNAATIQHNCGRVPKFIWAKSTNVSVVSNWGIYHAFQNLSTPEDFISSFNSDSVAESTTSLWQSNPPTDKEFYVAATTYNANIYTNYASMAYFLFADVPGVSKATYYVGNGQTGANGVFVDLGFMPKLLMIKGIAQAQAWTIGVPAWDSDGANPYTTLMAKMNNNGGSTQFNNVNFELYDNGFKVINNNATFNAANQLYMVWGCA